MGNDTSRATGTDFSANQRTRDRDNAAEDLPSIPYLKQKKVTEELALALRESIYYNNYKRAFRGYLRKKPEVNQMGTLYRIHNNALRDADLLGLPRDRYQEVVDRVVIKMAPDLNEDIIDFLMERKKLTEKDPPERKQRMAEDNLTQIFLYMGDDIVEQTGKKIYDKYSRGADYEVSDTEVDREKLAKMQAAKEERLKKAAEERQRQAEHFAREAAEEEAAQQRRQELVAQRQAEQKAIQKASESSLL
jgi:hypothetical protein